MKTQMVRFLTPMLGVLLLTGCPRPSGGASRTNPLVRQAEAISATDTKKAIELLKKALKGQPDDAQAHRLLGNLYYDYTHDYAAAIYHFQRYLELDRDSTWVGNINSQIEQSKVELAREESSSWINENTTREIQSLRAKNARLSQENKKLIAQVADLKRQLQGPATPGPAPVKPVSQQPKTRQQTHAIPSSTSPPGGPRKYTIRPKDTFFRIAKTHNLTVAELRAANPGLDPKRLKVGQKINLPTSPPR